MLVSRQISYDEADKDAFGNILNKGLTELVDSHNEGCLVTCSEITKCNLDKKWSWKYIETLFNRYVSFRIESGVDTSMEFLTWF